MFWTSQVGLNLVLTQYLYVILSEIRLIQFFKFREEEIGPYKVPYFETPHFQMIVFQTEVTHANGQCLRHIMCNGLFQKSMIELQKPF